ncbi:MAG: NADPH-dependent glutamate synthase, partial [Candidatus Omnitrophica bacterium]|nr:NADPH-dependent glutamate synthase [Candidatus Omnitrophota bacterium]
MPQQKMPKQKPEERVKNFFEVALGLSKEEAIQEAKRCLQCKKPSCVEGCPVQIDIPAFIKLIAEGKFSESIQKIKEKNNLPAICGRVCPQEIQCEVVCVLNKKSQAINIGALERFASDQESKIKSKERKNKKSEEVAVVGSGPAGLTAAADLVKIGYDVTLFESLHQPGGVLMYGIPEFRLPKKIVTSEVDYIKSLGVNLKTNILIGKSLTIDELFENNYKAIFIAVGAGLPQLLGIPGENANRVYSANEFLTRINLMKAYKFPEYATPINIGEKIAVVGAGNVAFDCARVSIRLGKDVTLVYRRSEKEMPARAEEIENAKEEGLKFHLLTQPTEILVDEKGFVKGLKCIKMQLGEPDASGRRRPVPIKNSEFVLDVDTVIVAIGQSPNPLLAKSTP